MSTPVGTRLTPREAAVARLLADGLANKEIAYRIGIQENNVKVVLSRMFRKLPYKSRLELSRAVLTGEVRVEGFQPYPGASEVARKYEGLHDARLQLMQALETLRLLNEAVLDAMLTVGDALAKVDGESSPALNGGTDGCI